MLCAVDMLLVVLWYVAVCLVVDLNLVCWWVVAVCCVYCDLLRSGGSFALICVGLVWVISLCYRC